MNEKARADPCCRQNWYSVCSLLKLMSVLKCSSTS